MPIFSSSQPETLKKNSLTITISPDGSSIVITDENGQKGGNVNSHVGKKVTWVNQAEFAGKVFQCKLTFREFLSDDFDQYGGPLWPFDPPTDPNPPNAFVVIADKTAAGSGNQFAGHLKQKNGVKYYKYDVELIATNGGTPPPALDPILIIEN